MALVAKTMRSQRIKTSFRIERFRLIRADNNLERSVNESYLNLLRLAYLSSYVLFWSCMGCAGRHDRTITIYFASVMAEDIRAHDIHAFTTTTLNGSRIHRGKKTAAAIVQRRRRA